MFKFIHTADIHLDSPLRGLEAHEGAPVEEIRDAARRAFDNLIEMAVDEAVDFVLIAGDLYDGDWKDYNTGLFFVSRMGRLRQAGIKVFLISGNHDAVNRITRTMPLPDNVTHFSSRKPHSVVFEECGVIVHGQSYSTRGVTENLATAYPLGDPDYFNIGLLHTSLTGREDHEHYAPCSLDDLKSRGYDYWALGHVHKREVVSSEPLTIFPGNIQGRHIKETGAKGATLITVDDKRIVDAEERELDVLRWGICEVDLSTCETADGVYHSIRSAFENQLRDSGSRPLGLRLLLTGECPVHSLLFDNTEQWTEEFRGIAASFQDLWLEKVKFGTRRKPDFKISLGKGTPLAGLIESIQKLDLEGENLLELVPDLASLRAKLPAEIFGGDDHFSELLSDENPELKKDVQELLISRLLTRGGER